jgi:S-adenosylmethionine hydrolase
VPRGVHLAVVDPKVGTPRRPLAVRSREGHQFVGPDNGLLWPAIERCGGIDVAIDITESPYRLDPVSATFHGRDLFAPVAARLALETPIENAGRPIPPETVARLEFPVPEVAAESIGAVVLAVDRFGNFALNAGREHMREAGFAPGDAVGVVAGAERRRAVFARTFADVPWGEAVIFEDSSGAVAVALNGGSAAEALGAGPGDDIQLRPWRE